MHFSLAFANQPLPAKPSRDDAVARVKSAVRYLKEHGKEKAITEFNQAKSPFNQGGMYMFGILFDQGGTEPIHPNPKIRGRQMIGLQDADGKFIIKELLATCESKGAGWVEYKWLNTQSNLIERKSSCVEKVADICLGTGIFQP